MPVKAFQSTFNPIINYIWNGHTERHPDSPYRSLWVTNLPPRTTEGQVRALFSAAGPLIAVDVVDDDSTQAMAHICYRSWDSGIKAMATLNDYFVRGRRIHVSLYLEDAATRRRPGGTSTIFLDGLPHSFSTTRLFECVKCFGIIVSVRFTRRDVGTPRRLARIEFVDQQAAEAAEQHLHMSTLHGQFLSAGPWDKRPINTRPTSPTSTSAERTPVQLYICPIEYTTTQEALLCMVESFGIHRESIKSIEWPRSKGHAHAFLEFYDPEVAKHAIYSMDQVFSGGRKLKVSPRRSNPGSHTTSPPSSETVEQSQVPELTADNNSVSNGTQGTGFSNEAPAPADLPNHPKPSAYIPNYIPRLPYPPPGMAPPYPQYRPAFIPPPVPPHLPYPYFPQHPAYAHPMLPPQPFFPTAMNVNVDSLILRDFHVHAGSRPGIVDEGKSETGSPPPYQ